LIGICLSNPDGGMIPKFEAGAGCILQSDCASGLICDPVTQSCESQYCFPLQIPPVEASCGSLQLNSSEMLLLDGGRCLTGGVEGCSPGASWSCCSGDCYSLIVFMGTINVCAPITFFY
jgi:hypothetical protein